MSNKLLPAVWLIVLIVGLPLLTETIYSPSLPDIASSLSTTASMAEYTLTVYLVALGLGTLFWGKLSDKIGRKPCVLAGLFIFLLGCIGCYFSTSIEMLMACRFIQAAGGSIGSVLGQSIARDSFHGAALGKVYADIGTSLAIFPAIGPILGGTIAQEFGWRSTFIFLMGFVLLMMAVIAVRLPETHLKESRRTVSMKAVALRLMRDKKVICFCLIIGGCNGISFSYFAEGAFYLIKSLSLSPTEYGLSFLLIAAASMLGGFTSKKLHDYTDAPTIMGYGLIIILMATMIASVGAFLAPTVLVTLLCQMVIRFGITMSTSNALSIALREYSDCVGTATSLFGFGYYSVTSLLTFGMGWLHNGSLMTMPLYFLAIAVMMMCVKMWRVKTTQ